MGQTSATGEFSFENNAVGLSRMPCFPCGNIRKQGLEFVFQAKFETGERPVSLVFVALMWRYCDSFSDAALQENCKGAQNKTLAVAREGLPNSDRVERLRAPEG